MLDCPSRKEGNRSRYIYIYSTMEQVRNSAAVQSLHINMASLNGIPGTTVAQWNVASKSYFNGQLYGVPLFFLREGSSLPNIYTKVSALSETIQGNVGLMG